MSLKFPFAAVAISLFAAACSQQPNPRPMSPGTPNATDTPAPSSPSSARTPDGTSNMPPNATTPQSQRPTPDSQR